MPSARFAGVPVPTTAPTFRTERFGLWADNTRASNSDTNSPVLGGLDSNGDPLRHFSTNGNAYWKHVYGGSDAAAMFWSKNRYFGIKCYIRPRSVSGRIQVWRLGSPGQGGPFFDIVDGKGRFGWWDNNQKREVYVETSTQVFWPGRVHYVFIKKRNLAPQTTCGNWEDSYWGNAQIRRLTMAADLAPTIGASVTDGTRVGTVIRQISDRVFDVYTTTVSAAWAGSISAVAISSSAVPSSDMFVVKRFPIFTDTPFQRTTYDAYVDAAATALGLDERNCTGFTSSDATRVAGVASPGVVSPPGVLATGAAFGVVTMADTDAGGGTLYYPPRFEMEDMYWTWGSGAGAEFAGKSYRIASVSATTPRFLVVADPSNLSTTPDFSTIVGPQEGQISTGIELIKSDGFDTSTSPDTSASTAYFMGSPDQGTPTSSYQPFDGEVWCPGWMMDTTSGAGVDARLFEDISATTNDPSLVGTDFFNEQIFTVGDSALKHQLAYTPTYTRFVWDGRTQVGNDIAASTQPETIPPDAIDTLGPTITKNPANVSATGASKPSWEYVIPRSVWAQDRYIAVGFRDPVQGINGRPGPTTRVKAIEDDDTNPSGTVRIIVTNIPTGPPGVEVVVWESAAGGNSATLFEATRAPNGTSEVAIESLEGSITLSEAADFAAYEPPRCGQLAASSARMIYGALEAQPDGMVPSLVGRPGVADFDKFFRLAGGSGDTITAMAELDGLLAVFKRRAMGSVRFTESGFAFVDLVSSGVGCVSTQTLQAKDSMLWFLSDRGVQVSQRDGVTNLGRPQYVGENVERFFERDVDLRRLSRASAAINRSRNQYVVAVRLADEPRANARITAEQFGQAVRFSRYSGPSICSLATVQGREAGSDLVVGGTEEGFMVWMDRSDTSLLMMGPDPAAWGTYQVQSYGGSSSSSLALNVQTVGSLDIDLAGPMGVTARFIDGGGIEREVSLLGSDGTILHYAEPLQTAIPSATQVMVGAAIMRWETPWLDMGNPETMKTLVYLDLSIETGDYAPTGTISVALYRDWDLDVARYEGTLDLGSVPHRIAPPSVRGRWFKLVMQHAPNTSNVSFDIAALVWRVRDEDQV